MKPIYSLFILFALLKIDSFGQEYWQYFDGNDSGANAIYVHIDTNSRNVWQIGSPHKVHFNSPATEPNVIVTDTVNSYPPNDTSSFTFPYHSTFPWGILAVRWKQKLDMERHHTGGIIEFSVDGGSSWQNTFNNPIVYNFYGFDPTNKDTLLTGEYAFSGTDTVWKDIWLCFDISFLSTYDSVMFKYTLMSDSVDSSQEGWMIDNLMIYRTMVHTVGKLNPEKDYIEVYPNITSGKVNIEAQKLNQYHIIEQIQLVNMDGQVVQEFGRCPVKYSIDIGSHPPGEYLLRIKTNIKTVTKRIILK